MLEELHAPILVQDEEALARCIDELARADRIAVDTEADSFYSYREKVCLIQVSARGCDWLIDPLAGLDLAPFGELLADPAKLKIFHDGEYDILLLKREHRFRFANLFDTRVAAAALGAPNPGLANVLLERFGVRLDKSMQRSDWRKRPLSAAQIAYARLDTHFLEELMLWQRSSLVERGRLAVVEGECRRLEALRSVEPRFDPDDWARLKGARELSPAKRRALRELFVLRDELARERDLSPFRVLQNDVLLALAARSPRTRHELAEVRGMSWRQVRTLGDAVLGALGRARSAEPIAQLPRLEPRDGTGQLPLEGVELHERLKSWRKKVADREGMDASLVLNRHVLLRIAQERPSDEAGLARVEGLLDWQRELYGADLIALLRRFETDLAAGRVELEQRRRPRR